MSRFCIVCIYLVIGLMLFPPLAFAEESMLSTHKMMESC